MEDGYRITSKKPSLKSLAGKKIHELERYAVRSSLLRKIAHMIYDSNFYSYISKRINEFKDLKLKQEVKKGKIPKHVAIIMDGNRRYAESFGLKPQAGHILGRDKIKEVLDWCFDLKIKNLTVYAFSTENFKREKNEVESLMNMCKNELDKAAKDSEIHKNKVKIRIFGHLESLPGEIQDSAEHIMDSTKEYEKFSFNVALAYGGREEIIQAIKKIASEVKEGAIEIDDIHEKSVSRYLYTNGIPDPDIILRTSGEERISNFLLWQMAYSEFYFSDVYWPAFQKRDFLKAIKTFQKRKRRFGE